MHMKREKEVCEDASKNVSDQAGRPETVAADNYLKDGAQLDLAGHAFPADSHSGTYQGQLLLLHGKRKKSFCGRHSF